MNSAKHIRHKLGWANIAFLLFAVFTAHPAYAQSPDKTPPNFKVAFIGDQGLGRNAQAVLQLIKDEGAQAVLHAGDFDYKDDPQAWDDQINATLGADFPYFAAVGNHDEKMFYRTNGYQAKMSERMNRLKLLWEGDLGVRSSFHFGGIFFVLTGPDIFDNNGYDQYIRDRLAQDNSIWSISAWHKNMRLMQVGDKSDEAGWGVYEESRKGGAIIATGHEHSYSRTHLLSSIINQTIADTTDTLVLTRDDTSTVADEGRSFVFVSGLGGNSIRRQRRSDEWWGAVYTSTQNANYGALFGIFNFDGIPNFAKFYFKDIDGVVPDSFFVVSEVEDFPVPVELAAFAAEIVQNTVVLTWESNTETNNFGFEIERKGGESSQWQKIGFVRGNGTTVKPIKYEFFDADLPPGVYEYRLKQIDTDGPFEYSSTIQVTIGLPTEFALYQNYPNPFNPTTRIEFALPEASEIKLMVYDLMGHRVKTLAQGRHETGYHHLTWEGRNGAGELVAGGVYLYRLTVQPASGGEAIVQTKKLTFLK